MKNISDAAANGLESQLRLAKIENNVGWLKGIGAFGAGAIIATLGWLNIQSLKHGERPARVKTRLDNIEAEMKTVIERLFKS